MKKKKISIFVLSLIMCFAIVVGALNISNTYCYDYSLDYDYFVVGDVAGALNYNDYSFSFTMTYYVDISECSLYLYDFELNQIAVDKELTYTNIDNFWYHVTGSDIFYLRFSNPPETPFHGLSDCLGFIAISDNATYYFVPSFIDALNVGYRAGYKVGADDPTSYDAGYSAGYSDGKQLVLDDPNDYGFYTNEDYMNYGGLKYQEGYSAGTDNGYSMGQTNGYNNGFSDGKNEVIQNPSDYDLYSNDDLIDYGEEQFTNGCNEVVEHPSEYDLVTKSDYDSYGKEQYTKGYNVGESDVINDPHSYNLRTDDEFINLYNTAFNDGADSVGTFNFLYLLSAVVDTPVSAFKSLFNFNLLGYNLTTFFTAIITLCILIYVLRIVFRGK